MFTKDGESFFLGGGPVKCAEAIAKPLRAGKPSPAYSCISCPLADGRKQHASTEHALTDQHPEIAEDGQTVKSIAYCNSMHFGRGEWEGKDATCLH